MSIKIPKEVTEVVNVLKKSKNIKAIGLYGSLGTGFADKFTDDFDIVVFCRRIPSRKWREKVLKPVIKKMHSAYSIAKIIDIFDIGNLEGGIWYKKVSEIKNYIKLFKKGMHFVDDLGTFIHYSKPLYDPDILIRNWKKTIRKYPDWLRKREISLLTGTFRFTRGGLVEKALERKNINYLNNRMAEIKTWIEKVVFALNKTYYNGKWASKFYSKFKLLPKDFIKKLNRFNNLKGISLKEKVKILDHLASEIYEITKKEIPDLEIRIKFK